MYQQRAPLKSEAYVTREDLWQPRLPGRVRAQPDDAYVVVDELLDGVVTLAVTPWPHLDGAGRLCFTGEIQALHHPAAEFEDQVVSAREAGRQPSARRPLRIGDAFLARPGAMHPSEWQSLFDVSGDAREMAKIAFYGAAAPVARDRERAQERAFVEPSDLTGQANTRVERRRRPPGPMAQATV